MKIAPDMQYEIGQDKVGYFPEWSVKDDATLWQKVNKLAHSTYVGDQPSDASPLDPKKFTYPAGHRPNITDDGIISNITTSNYVYTAVTFSFSTADNWDVEFDYTFNSNGGNVQRFISGRSSAGFILDSQTGNYCYLYLKSQGSSTYDIASAKHTGFKFTAGTKYHIRYSFTGSSYELYIDGNKINDATVDSTTKIGNAALNLFTGGDFAPAAGEQNLKSLVVRINGVEVFSGNKTGIDTIKPSKFTATTGGQDSPFENPALPFSDNGLSITADGIVSGFSSNGRYLRQALSVTPKREVLIKGKFTYTPDSHVQVIFNCGLTRLGISSTYVTVNYYDNSHTTYNHACSEGDIIEFELLVKADKQTLSCKINGISGTPVNTSHELTLSEITYCLFGQYSTSGYGNSFAGTIDLPVFEFYVDGELIYQPLLCIPYTEAKGNKKVVDKKYRPRVKDLFEQKGYNIYYTLGEDDFTLPSNKPNDIVKYKANGLTVAEQRADQTLTIRGACESGVDVNLPMDFFDGSSYAVFGVGTTGTNTASKFTPAADGNYIAIGKGKV